MQPKDNWDWSDKKRILCIRPDNIGDVLMTTPALKALKENQPERSLTLLTSHMAIGIADLLPMITDSIELTVPWVQSVQNPDLKELQNVVAEIKKREFEAAIVFNVFSQNPFPTLLLAYLAQIPSRLVMSRENPWGLATHWVPDSEPFLGVRHEVQRQLDLVAKIGARTTDDRLVVSVPPEMKEVATAKLRSQGISGPWLILHPGVSEPKRQYSLPEFGLLGKLITNKLKYTVLLTGSPSERELTTELQSIIGPGSFALAGEFSLPEFIGLIAESPLIITNNTGPAHIAAATQTPVIDLYALTNPQHTPWMVKHKTYYFPVAEEDKNPDPILRYIEPTLTEMEGEYPSAEIVFAGVKELLRLS